MALTHVGTSAPTFDGGYWPGVTVTAVVPDGAQEGDWAILFAVIKHGRTQDFDPATFGNWTLVRNRTLGVDNNPGPGQGLIRVGIFRRQIPAEGIADSKTIGIVGSPSYNAGPVSGGVISIWRADGEIEFAGAAAEDTNTVTAFNLPFDVDPGLSSRDRVMLVTGYRDDNVRHTSASLAAPGATFSPLTTQVESSTTLGDDISMIVQTGEVLTGTASGPATFNGTVSASASGVGGTILIRIREVDWYPSDPWNSSAPWGVHGGSEEPPPAATVTGTGALTGGSGAVQGSGTVTTPTVAGAGALAPAAGSLTGSGALRLSGAGALSTGAPALSGTGTARLSGAGALAAGAPALSGGAALQLTGSGSLTAAVPMLSGTGTGRLTGSGALVAASPTLSGTGTAVMPLPDTVTGAGALTAGTPTLTGAGVSRLAGAGALDAPERTLTGSGVLRITGTGVLSSASPTLSGPGALRAVGSGVLAAQAAVLSGAALVQLAGNGVLSAAPAALSSTGGVYDLDARRNVTVTRMSGPAPRSIIVRGPYDSRAFVATGPRS